MVTYEQVEESEGPKCQRCGDDVDREGWHECPLKSELHCDSTECNCCSACQHQCAMDI